MINVGIFFGGHSREREVSFAGGRTVYDNLNKSIFHPVPIFVDSLGNFVLLRWEYIYKGTIRDFYPPLRHTPDTFHQFQVYIESLGTLSKEKRQILIEEVGEKIQPEQFSELFDFAFLALHGPYGEDGNIQGLLEWYGIPYTGSGILPSAIGIDKHLQKSLFDSMGFSSPSFRAVSKDEWLKTDHEGLMMEIAAEFGLPFVVKAVHQGSSIGVSVINDKKNATAFRRAVSRALFLEEIEADFWMSLSKNEKVSFISDLIDIRQGIGLPVVFIANDRSEQVIYHPEDLLSTLENYFEAQTDTVILEALQGEEEVLFERFIKGREFSCIVIQDENGLPVALPPTEIVKGRTNEKEDVFDYRSKYLPGMVHKITPIPIAPKRIRKIQDECCRMFGQLHFSVYARIDGFITEDDTIYLNDPNTTSGMLPSSFFFHQSAEIGLNPSQFLTYIIRTSLSERIRSGKDSRKVRHLLHSLDTSLKELNQEKKDKIKVGVIMGGYSSERHISVESGRNIYEKLSSSNKYEPIPIFLTDNELAHELYVMPINILLKDNADDIKAKIYHVLETDRHEIVNSVIEDTRHITEKYAGNAIFIPKRLTYPELANLVDVVFIALHGRPGEDGALQQELDQYNIPYNGSGVESSGITIDKYRTTEILGENGVLVAKHLLVKKQDWLNDPEEVVYCIESRFPYPLIAKPSDDGCSSAVKKINTQEELNAYLNIIFRESEEINPFYAERLKLQKNEEFPAKSYFLIEELISKKEAKHFLEITGGMVTVKEGVDIVFEVFEPSETLATSDILTLEEKFLAGEGQNITPARFSSDLLQNTQISQKVRTELEKVAKILKVEGYCRIDAFVRIYENGEVETIIIEVNSLPGMTPATCIFHQSALQGYKPYDFIDKILEYGMRAKAENN